MLRGIKINVTLKPFHSGENPLGEPEDTLANNANFLSEKIHSSLWVNSQVWCAVYIKSLECARIKSNNRAIIFYNWKWSWEIDYIP